MMAIIWRALFFLFPKLRREDLLQGKEEGEHVGVEVFGEALGLQGAGRACVLTGQEDRDCQVNPWWPTRVNLPVFLVFCFANQ